MEIYCLKLTGNRIPFRTSGNMFVLNVHLNAGKYIYYRILPSSGKTCIFLETDYNMHSWRKGSFLSDRLIDRFFFCSVVGCRGRESADDF